MDPLALERDVRAAASGSPDAYARIIHGHRHVVSSITLAIVRDVPSSEEIAQDVFIEAWRALPRLRNPASFLPWLRQLARNRAHRFLERRQRQPEPHEAALESAIDPQPGAELRLIRDEERRVLQQALEALPDESRELLTLFYREGRSVRQVAALFGLSEDATKQRLSRARSRLRADVEARFAGIVERTAPGDGFSAVVVAALPHAAQASTLALAFKLAPLGKALFGILPGVVGSFAGLYWGLRKNLALSIDDRERREHVRMTAVCAAICLSFSVAMVFVPRVSHPKALLVAASVLLLGGINACMFLWLPRILRRRVAADLAADPVGARLRLDRQRRSGLRGVTLGTVLALIPIVWFLAR